jgi:hypothetical protein
MSLSTDGRYIVYQVSCLFAGFHISPRAPAPSRHYTVWLWDIFADSHFELADLAPQACHSGFSLHVEHDLLLVYHRGETTLWHLNDLSAPLFSQTLDYGATSPRVRPVQDSSSCGLADSGRYLVVRVANSNEVSVLQVDALKRQGLPAARVLSWKEVDAFAFSSASSDVLIAADQRVQHWNVDTRQMLHEEDYAHFPAPPGLLAMSQDGTRAVACPWGSGKWGAVQESCAWALREPSWPLTRFPSLDVCRARYAEYDYGRPHVLSSDGRFWAYSVSFYPDVDDEGGQIDDDDFAHHFTILHDLISPAAPPLAVRDWGDYDERDTDEAFRSEMVAKLLFIELAGSQSAIESSRPVELAECSDSQTAEEASWALERVNAQYVEIERASDAAGKDATSPAPPASLLRDQMGWTELFAAELSRDKRWVALSGGELMKIVLGPLTAPHDLYDDAFDMRPYEPSLHDEAGVD